jgi:selenide,water dikinase
MARNSKVTLTIRAGDLPLLSQAATLAQQGFVTGASLRNWASYGQDINLPPVMPEWQRHLLTDPQTSGGLLISCAPERADAVVRSIVAEGYAHACMIGRAKSGPPLIDIDL